MEVSMTPVQVIEKLLKVNKPVAILLLTGLGVLAVASVALSWLGEQPNALLVSLYILALGFVATIITIVCTNEWMRRVLGWVVTGVFTLYLVGLIDSALSITGRLPTPTCYLRIFVEHPDACEARLFPSQRVADASPQNRFVRSANMGGATERLWLAQSDTQITGYSEGPIYLHYGGNISADDAMALGQTLTDSGWPIAAEMPLKREPDTNEVRYFDPADAGHALELAKRLKELRPGADVFIRDFSRSGLLAHSGQLEVWATN